MAASHLGHNWYFFDLSEALSEWILLCLSEHMDFVQPYDTMYIRAKRTLNGNKVFKLVFSAEYQGYNLPVCYLMDLNTGKFKGNRMHYCIDSSGTHYADKFPVYGDHFKFGEHSRYNQEKRDLWIYLNSLEIPEHIMTSKERRTERKRKKRQQEHQRRVSQPNHRMPPYVRRKKKKGTLMKGIRVI